jgi:hypothetical protein
LSCKKPAVANDNDSASIVLSIKKLAKETKNLKKAAFHSFKRQARKTPASVILNQKKRTCIFSLTMDSNSHKWR